MVADPAGAKAVARTLATAVDSKVLGTPLFPGHHTYLLGPFPLWPGLSAPECPPKLPLDRPEKGLTA
jgi:hypothetical protein